MGPPRARGRVGRAEAQVASMLTRSTVYAILLLNASVMSHIDTHFLDIYRRAISDSSIYIN